MSSVLIGLLIGWVSLVAFCAYIIRSSSKKYKEENPERYSSLNREVNCFLLWGERKRNK